MVSPGCRRHAVVAKKKSKKKTGRAKRPAPRESVSARAAPRTPAAGRSARGPGLDIPELGAPPVSDDPEVMAGYFVEMIDALGRGTSEMKRVRDVLVGCVESYYDNPDKDEAKEIFAARMAGLEEGVAALLHGHIKRLRDQLTKDSRRLGTGTKVGRAARVGADAFTLFADGLQKLIDAAANPALRTEAQATMKRAHAKMLELEAATRSG